MGGGIELESGLGRGTKITFWISFHKPQLRAAVIPQLNMKPIPSRLEAEPSMTGRRLSQQKLGDDCLNALSAAPKPFLAKSAIDICQPSAEIKPPSRAGQEPSSVHDIERENIHILVVEDK